MYSFEDVGEKSSILHVYINGVAVLFPNQVDAYRLTLAHLSSLDAGVIGGCGELCQLLEQAVKINSSLVEVVCDLLCDYVGIEEFIKLVDK